MTTDISADELKVFLQEAESLLATLDEHIVRLEQEGPAADLVQEIFRVAHTLKGSSGMLGLDRMTHVTHQMEDLFDRVRKGTLGITEEIIDALLMSLDVLRVLKDDVAAGVESSVDVSQVVDALRRAADSPVADAPGQAAESVSLLKSLRSDAALREQVSDARAEHPVLHLQVTLDSQSQWLAVRCFQLLNELDQWGEVLVSSPTQADIEAEQVTSRLEALISLRGEPDASALDAALRAIDDVRGTEIVAVEAFHLLDHLPEPGAGAAPGAPASESVAAAAAPRSEPLASSVRVDVEQIDALMNMVGELVIDRTRVSQLSRVLSDRFDDDDVRSLGETSVHLEKLINELHERMMQIRMLPVGLLFSKFPRLVRDLSRSLGKSIRLELDGEDTEIDRSVIEQIKDPLVHLIRNACDHGIEDPLGREANGKPEISILKLSASHQQGQIVITLADDGRGIDVDRVKAKAIERGLISADKADRLSQREVVDLIFAPGLSTAAQATEVSGRGVGMDIVRRDIESLGGRIEVETSPGRGTTFRLRLPLTLATFRGLLVGCGQAVYAIPLSYVQETLRPSPEQLHTVGTRPVLHLRTRDLVMPIVRLADVLGAEGESAGATSPYVVVVRAGESETERPVAIAVDRLIDQQDIVVKSLSSFLGRTQGVAGASILGDGRVVLIVDVPSLIKSSREVEHSGAHENLLVERIAS